MTPVSCGVLGSIAVILNICLYLHVLYSHPEDCIGGTPQWNTGESVQNSLNLKINLKVFLIIFIPQTV